MLCKDLLASPGIRLSETGRERFPELQSYLAFLRGSFGGRVDQLDLSKITGLKVEDNRLVIERVDKLAINRAIQETTTEEKKSTEIPQAVLNGITSLQANQFNNKISQLEAGIARYSLSIQSKTQEIMNDFAHMAKLEIDILHLKTGQADLGIQKCVEKILSDGFWKEPYFKAIDNTLEFKATDVWLGFNDLDAKINRSINLGDFVIAFRFTGTGLHTQILAVGNNITVRGFVHPHVSDGYICLGNASASFEEATKKLDLAAMAHIARLILTTYNADNPYVSFSHFDEEFKRRQNAAVRITSEQQIRTEYERTVTAAGYSDDADLFFDDIPEPNF